MKKFIPLLLFLLLRIVTEAQQSIPVTFPHDGKVVNGTFTFPNGMGKFPTVIINPGSGAINRDGNFKLNDGNSICLFPAMRDSTLMMYKELADALVDSGYAVLRYDKLEYSYPNSLGTITFHKLWLPVESAIDYVKTWNDVDTNNIILIGHSEGSALIPYIARGRSDVKALISIAGARTPFDSLYAWQLTNLVALLRHCGATANDSINAQIQADQVHSYFNAIRNNTWNGSTPAAFGVPASAWYDYIRATDSVADNYNLDNLPTLFTGMGMDIQVPPAELVRLQNDVTITNDFWSIPGLTHYMTTDSVPHVSQVLTDTIIYWLRGHITPTGINDISPDENVIHTYPNPFTSVVSITLRKQNLKQAVFKVSNILGQTIFKQQENNLSGAYSKTIDLSFLSNGIYFLEISTDGKRKVEKIVKE